MTSDLLAPLFTSEEMRRAFSAAEQVRAMATFEAPLAEAEGEAGVIPAEAASAIADACRTYAPDLTALALATRAAGNLAIPFVKALTAHCPEEARGYVHWGATSQDVIDTALVLQIRTALGLLEADLLALGDGLAELASCYREVPMAGRTLQQPALPITFGFKCAGWLQSVLDARASLEHAARRAIVLQFGGAVGTLAALGSKGPDVRTLLGRRLGLTVPAIAWHANRGNIARLCSELGVLSGALAKIAGDVALMMQPEVGEAAEPAAPGRGGSSTMPQKRNPVAAIAVRANAVRANGLVATMLAAMPQEHERAAGGWHAEWTAVPELFEVAAGALRHTRETIDGLEVNTQRMRANLDIGHGTLMAEALMMALAPHAGRDDAHHLVGELAATALAEGRPLAAVVAGDPRVTKHLDETAITRALDPGGYLGTAGETVDTVVAAWQAQRR